MCVSACVSVQATPPLVRIQWYIAHSNARVINKLQKNIKMIVAFKYEINF